MRYSHVALDKLNNLKRLHLTHFYHLICMPDIIHLTLLFSLYHQCVCMFFIVMQSMSNIIAS